MNNNMMQMYQQFRQNPLGMLSQKYSIPQGLNDPFDIIQHLLNTSQVSQGQVNKYMNMRNNPMIQQLMNMK